MEERNSIVFRGKSTSHAGHIITVNMSSNREIGLYIHVHVRADGKTVSNTKMTPQEFANWWEVMEGMIEEIG